MTWNCSGSSAAPPSPTLAQAKQASKARDIGFRFGRMPAGGRIVRSYSASYPAASFTFRWSAAAKRWLVWMDGAPALATEGGQLGGATVVIQYTIIRTSRFLVDFGLPSAVGFCPRNDLAVTHDFERTERENAAHRGMD